MQKQQQRFIRKFQFLALKKNKKMKNLSKKKNKSDRNE